MSIRTIVRADDKTLQGPSESPLRTSFVQVAQVNEEVLRVVQDLRDTLHSDDLSVGLAAPQLAIRMAIAVVNLRKHRDEDLVLINPVIVEECGPVAIRDESCMSIPHKKGKVPRPSKVTVRYIDTEGRRQSLQASGFLARVLCHEIDHVNGVLFVDRMADGEHLEDTDLFRDHGIE